jgi:hypothetical protein
VNACLLAQSLPVIVINYADRERYLHCLTESNKGDLSALVEFMIDCFDQQIGDLADPPASPFEKLVEAVVTRASIHVDVDPIVAVLEEAGVVDADDPLTAIMKAKVVERQRTVEADYEAWKQSVLTIPAELRAVVEAFNANDVYTRVGYRMKCQIYDLLTLEKYVDIASGRNASRTWFVGLEMVGPASREKAMWFFNAASWVLRQESRASRVSLAISRFDGTRYMRLDTEPISLREIGYRQETLLFVLREKKVEEGSIRKALQGFLADIIRSYL